VRREVHFRKPSGFSGAPDDPVDRLPCDALPGEIEGRRIRHTFSATP